MTTNISSDIIESFKTQLENHPVYEAVETIEDLQCFMEHHIFSVWDFMSLIKYLQAQIAPTQVPWLPQGDGSVRRFINELVMEEESDETHIAGKYSSHFELYQNAMKEIGADISLSTLFIQTVQTEGIKQALALPNIPKPSHEFTSATFSFLENNKPHQVAAVLALGREHIVPCMFRAILKKIGVSDQQAPIFHYYLNKHIQLDEDFHAPLSLRLLNGLCDNEQDVNEAIDAANQAVTARIVFWDGVYKAILARKS
ncbi:MAG: DUF3050 domain-containing protein [Pseudomonadota bacterium]